MKRNIIILTTVCALGLMVTPYQQTHAEGTVECWFVWDHNDTFNLRAGRAGVWRGTGETRINALIEAGQVRALVSADRGSNCQLSHPHYPRLDATIHKKKHMINPYGALPNCSVFNATVTCHRFHAQQPQSENTDARSSTPPQADTRGGRPSTPPPPDARGGRPATPPPPTTRGVTRATLPSSTQRGTSTAPPPPPSPPSSQRGTSTAPPPPPSPPSSQRGTSTAPPPPPSPPRNRSITPATPPPPSTQGVIPAVPPPQE